VPNTTTGIATDSDSAIASQQEISAEMATIASDYAIYCGVPDANTAFRIASHVLADFDAEAGAQ
jgi:alkylhydroperoxidase/carboxymuconolactone decarboxylase family protein YurZ